jgi:hypothetical protein
MASQGAERGLIQALSSEVESSLTVFPQVVDEVEYRAPYEASEPLQPSENDIQDAFVFIGTDFEVRGTPHKLTTNKRSFERRLSKFRRRAFKRRHRGRRDARCKSHSNGFRSKAFSGLKRAAHKSCAKVRLLVFCEVHLWPARAPSAGRFRP